MIPISSVTPIKQINAQFYGQAIEMGKNYGKNWQFSLYDNQLNSISYMMKLAESEGFEPSIQI